MRVLLCIDGPRLQDDLRVLQTIARALRDAQIEQIHLVPEPPLGVEPRPLADGISVLSVRMPTRLMRRMTAAQRMTDSLARCEPDVIFCSGSDSHRVAADLAATFDVPLMVDAWRAEHLASAQYRTDVEAWMARSGAVADVLRRTVRSGTVIEARPPLPPDGASRIPGNRPSIVLLDPESRPRDVEPLIVALGRMLEQREDLEAFLELRGGRAHRTWRLLQNHNLLERVTVLDDAGPLAKLVSQATVVIAAGAQLPARTVTAHALAGGAAFIASAGGLEDLIQDGRTAIVVDSNSEQAWFEAAMSLLLDTTLRGELSRNASAAARRACNGESTTRTWVDAFSAAVEPAAYPLGAP